MPNMNHLKERLARMRYQAKKRKMVRSELYAHDRSQGMTYAAIAEKHGVSVSAVFKGVSRYHRRQEQEARYGK